MNKPSLKNRRKKIVLKRYHETNEQLSAILNIQQEMICRFTAEGVLVYVNEAYCRAFGKKREELQGCSFFQLIPQEQHQAVREKIKHLIATGETITYEHQVLDQGGHRRWQQWTDTVAKRENGQVVELQSCGHDITRRVNLEQELRAHQLFLNTLLTNTPAVIYAYRINGKGEVTISYVSPNIEAVLGASYTSFINSYDEWCRRIHPDDLENYLQVKSKGDGKVEFRVFDQWGRIRWLYDQQRVLQDLGNHKEVVGSLWEITDRKMAEAVSQRAVKEARTANETKSRFLAKTSHEIRNPINGMMGALQLLENTALDNRQKRYVSQLSQSSENLTRILDDILDISKMEAGKLTLEHVTIELMDLVDTATVPYIQQAQQKGLEIEKMLLPSLHTQIKGDPVRIRQIISNMLSNAIKFTENGRVRIRSMIEETESEVKILGGAVGKQFIIQVQDTGIGMTDEVQRTLFEPFIQAEASFTRRYGGTGLGMTIVNELVSLMQGNIRVESKPDIGTTITVTIPVEIISDTTTLLKDDEQLKGSHFLLVNLSSGEGHGMTTILEKLGCHVTSVEEVEQALKVLMNQEETQTLYQGVIMAEKLKGMTSDDFVDIIRKIPSISQTPCCLHHSFSMMDRMNDAEQGQIVHWQRYDAVMGTPLKRSEVIASLLKMQRTNGKKAEEKSTAFREGDESLQEVPVPLEILVAEDQEGNRELVLEMLHISGYKATTVANGEEAIKACEGKAFDLIFMDWQMPYVNGDEATRRIQEGSAEKKPLIVAMTAVVMPEEKKACLKAGVAGIMEKPIKMKTLKHWLKQAALLREENQPK
ncbi:ATP-binding protein [Anoxynatronum sibiricum]|uniref:Stage 0 sporulation protein A homolog n=1 Tax=Anoxynatronum sibiricum TaxID=210623 RepID=A0ABU9VWG9_9CLOT